MDGTTWKTQYASTNIDEVLLNGKFKNVITVAKTKAERANYYCDNPVYANSDAACIQAALSYISSMGGGELKIMGGHYNCAGQLSYSSSNITISGQVGATILDFSTAPSSPSSLIDISGSVTTTNSALSVNAYPGTLTITVGDGTKFAAGNWIRIRSEAYFRAFMDPDGSHSTMWGQTVGEIQQIESVNGNILTLKEFVLGTYLTTDTATVDLVSMIENIKVQDLHIIAPVGVAHSGIYISQAHRVRIYDVFVEDANYTSVGLRDVVDATINGNTTKRSTVSNTGYGLAVGNCSRDIVGIGNHFYNCRHGIMCGGDYNYGVQYNQTYIANTMSYDQYTVGLFGPHPTYKGLVAMGNVCTGCALGFFGGSDNTVLGNTIYSRGVAGIVLPEWSENTILANNTIHVATNHGINVFSTLSTIDIHDNVIYCDDASSAGICLKDQTQHVKCHDNEIHSLGIGIMLYADAGAGGSSHVSLTHNDIQCTGSYPGISIQSPAFDISDIEIKDNDIVSSSDGIYIKSVNKNVTNAVIEQNRVTVPATKKGIYLEGTGTGVYTRSSITGNKVYGGLDSIYTINCTTIDVKNNDVYDSAGYGLRLRTGCTGFNVDHNNFVNCATPLTIGSSITGSSRVSDNIGYNPVGFFTAPSVPASGSTVTNNYGYPCEVYIHAGTITAININGTATGLLTGSFIVGPGETIGITYTGSPAWTWKGL